MVGPSFNNPEHIIWIQTGFLGDIVLTTAAFVRASTLLPSVKQHLITTSIGAAALKDHPNLASIHVFRKTERSFLAASREVRESITEALGSAQKVITIQAHRSFRSGLLARVLKFPVIAFAESDLALFAKRVVPRIAVMHEADRYSLLMTALGFSRSEVLGQTPFLEPLPLLPSEAAGDASFWVGRLITASTANPKRGLVGVAPGSVWGTKRWTPEGFASVLNRVLKETKATLVMLGSKAEQSLTSEIMECLIDKDRVIDTAGETTLDDLRRIYPLLDRLISNDSSSIHYASAFRVPTVAVFGATVPGMGFGPLAPRSHVVEHEFLDCRPCSDHGPKVCPLGHFRCMRDLDPARVYAALDFVSDGDLWQ